MTTPETPQPADQTSLRDRIAAAVDEGFRLYAELEDTSLGDSIVDSVLTAVLTEAAASAVVSPPTDRAAEVDRLRTENERMRHELEVMYGGAFDSLKPEPADRAAVLREAADWYARQGKVVLAAAQVAADLRCRAEAELCRMADEAQQQPDTETPADEQPTEEQIVRDHVTSLHLIGEQLAEVESWMWAHLAYVRERAVMPAPVAQQPAAEEEGELVCVDQCGSCDACGMEPFGTPAEGWREAARFLRRTPRDSVDFPGAIRGARLIEDELRRMVDEAQPAQCETPDYTDGPCHCPSCDPAAHRGNPPADRAAILRAEADEIVAHCPDHGSADGVWMDCHCAVADDMRKRADEAQQNGGRS